MRQPKKNVFEKKYRKIQNKKRAKIIFKMKIKQRKKKNKTMVRHIDAKNARYLTQLISTNRNNTIEIFIKLRLSLRILLIFSVEIIINFTQNKNQSILNK